MKLIRQTVSDRNERPFMVIWEITQACDLACKNCRAESQPNHHPNALVTELRSSEARHFTERDTPIFTAIYHTPEEMLELYV